MSTVIRSDLSKKNKYYISKHRYLELKHFCLQYPEWISEYNRLSLDISAGRASADGLPKGSDKPDRTSELAVKLAGIKEKIRIVEETAVAAEPSLSNYILKAVTEEKAFPYLKTVMDIPCDKGMYYDRYRKFFWILSHEIQSF